MLLRVFNKIFIFSLALQMHIVDCNSNLTSALNKTRRHRPKRSLYFTYYSGFALDVILSLPLELPSSNTAFCSFTFAANFFLPTFDYVNGIIPTPFAYIVEPGVIDGSKNRIESPSAYRQFKGDGVEQQVRSETTKTVSSASNSSEENSVEKNKRKAEKRKKKQQMNVPPMLNNYFMSRRRFYKMMETKMDSSGLNGIDCLLKAICETSESSFGYNNGVIGSIVDVLFLPSASKDEKLPKRYYRAEANGKSGNCTGYNQNCPKSILTYTYNRTIEDLFKSYISNKKLFSNLILFV